MNTEQLKELKPAPKYDPCRLFKKGDKVRVVERLGRKFWEDNPETIYTVVADEYLHDDRRVLHRGCVGLNDGKPETCSSWNVPFFHVELVTPVEELEPYRVDHNQYGWHVEKDGEIVATYNDDRHPHAKEAAEAECARLNAEHRKEQK